MSGDFIAPRNNAPRPTNRGRRQIERGNWKEPKRVIFVLRVDRGRPIICLDLRGMMRERGAERRAQVEDTPASFNTGSSLADRVRVLTDEEWASL
jgi:hypothetical protein